MKNKPRFISAGWMVAIKSSLLSLSFALLGLLLIDHYLDKQLLADQQSLHQRDKHLFTQLRTSNVDVQLGFIETLDLADTSSETLSLEKLITIIDRNWQSLNLLNGIVAMNIYDRQSKLLKYYGNAPLHPKTEVLQLVSDSGEPQDYISCTEYCWHIVSAPFLVDNNKNLVLIWATPAASLLETFSNVTDSATSLIKLNTNKHSVAFISANASIAGKNFAELSEQYQKQIKQKPNQKIVHSNYQGKHLSLNALQLDDIGNDDAYVFWIRDISAAVETAQQTLHSSLWIMSIAGIILFALIIVFLRSLTHRSHRLAKILPLLTEAKFEQAEQQLKRYKHERIFRDEIDILFETSAVVTGQLKSLNQQLHNLAYRDSLTQLPNRQSLYEGLNYHLRQFSRHAEYLGLLFIDVDGFKAINDTYGHKAGDFILISLAQQVAAVLREADTLYRLAGDEFVIIVTDVKNSEGLSVTADKVIASMDRAFEFEGNQLRVSLSIGGVISNEMGAQADHLINKADEAMYHSKQTGKGRYTFHGQL